MADARPFGRAGLGGNPVGRPRTANPEPDPRARALIAAGNWLAKRGAAIGSGVPISRSAQSGGAISAARGEARRSTRFEGESQPFSSGGAAANPWS